MNRYPWINFSLNLNNFSAKVWIQLGECLSKCEHISRIPLLPSVAKKMHYVYLAKGVQATTAIEGNTLTEEQVRLNLENRLELPSSRQYLKQEIDNIIQLCNEITQKIAQSDAVFITVDQICRFNRIVLQNIPCHYYVVPGKLRTYPVGVGNYKAPDAKDIPQLMEKMCQWLNSSDFDTGFSPIITAIIKAIVAHLYLAWLHPFGDGNGRTARILEFAILLASGIPSPAAHLLSNHYNLTRTRYYQELDLASKRNSPYGFIAYAVEGFCDGLKEQLQYIFNQVTELSWQSYIYETFHNYKHNEVTTKRRRTLALALSHQSQPVLKENLTSLTPELMAAYRKKTDKTLNRDIKELEQLGLIKKTPEGYVARKESILSFLPFKVSKQKAR